MHQMLIPDSFLDQSVSMDRSNDFTYISSSVRSFVRSFVLFSIVRSFVPPFLCSFVPSFDRMFFRLFVHLSVRPFVHQAKPRKKVVLQICECFMSGQAVGIIILILLMFWNMALNTVFTRKSAYARKSPSSNLRPFLT